MRSLGAPSALLIVVLMLSGCATTTPTPTPTPTPIPHSAAQSPAPPAPTPDAGTVQEYAPDPQQASIHISWAFDVSDIREVIQDADSIALATVKSIDARGTFEFSEGGLPVTRVNVETREVLRGDAPRNGDVYVLGGTVTLQQVFESDPIESTEKNGIAAMDEKERRSKTIDYVPSGPVKLEVGKEYALMIREADEGVASVSVGGYGVFEAIDHGYANHLTGETFTMDELVTMVASRDEQP